MTNSSNRDAKHGGAEPRRPYQAPAIEDVAAFETLALTCFKNDGDYTCQDRGGYDIS